MLYFQEEDFVSLLYPSCVQSVFQLEICAYLLMLFGTCSFMELHAPRWWVLLPFKPCTGVGLCVPAEPRAGRCPFKSSSARWGHGCGGLGHGGGCARGGRRGALRALPGLGAFMASLGCTGNGHGERSTVSSPRPGCVCPGLQFLPRARSVPTLRRSAAARPRKGFCANSLAGSAEMHQALVLFWIKVGGRDSTKNKMLLSSEKIQPLNTE